MFTSQQSQHPLTRQPPPAAMARPAYGSAGLQLLGRWVQGLLVTSGVLFSLSAIAALNGWNVYAGARDGRASMREVLVAESAYFSTVALAFLAVIPTGIVMIVWLFRYWGQLRSLRPTAHLRFGQGWTIGAWFLPIANLFIPKMIINDFWRSSASNLDNGTQQRVASLVHWWWATWIAGVILNTTTGGELEWPMFYFTSTLTGAMIGASGVLGGLVVRDLVFRLDAICSKQ